jgi:hypothetical protein
VKLFFKDVRATYSKFSYTYMPAVFNIPFPAYFCQKETDFLRIELLHPHGESRRGEVYEEVYGEVGDKQQLITVGE